MWKGYKRWDFPASSDRVEVGGNLHQLEGYSRIGEATMAN
jgi:hypothetical protein